MKDADTRRFVFSSAGDFLTEGELLDWRGGMEVPILLFAIGKVHVINLHKLIGSMKRKSLTTVLGKTQMNWQEKELEKSDMNWVRVEKRKTSTLTVHRFLFSSQELESSQLKTNKKQQQQQKEKSMFCCSRNFQVLDHK